MSFFIAAIIVLCIIIAIVFIFRRKHRTEIQRLEQNKQQIQNKPVLEELMKVKALNMNGQTEEMFERWRNKWTELMDVEMPKIDELLFDAEEQVDKFRFGKATEIEKDIDSRITEYDNEMAIILKELDELVGSEEKNRVEIEQLKEQYRSARKTLLAHQYSYGPAAVPLEKRLETFTPQFEEYEELTSSGNYLKARELVVNLSNEGQKTFKLINEIPTLLTEIQHKIPSDIHEIRNGHREMEDQSYFLVHLEILDKLEEMEKSLAEFKQKVADLDIDNVQQQVEVIKDEIESFYDALEKEVIGKKYVDLHFVSIGEQLESTLKATEEMAIEAEAVQKSYRLPSREAEIPKNCKQQLLALQQRYDFLAVEVREEQSAYSSMEEVLKELKDSIENLFQEQKQFAERMNNLRIDENKARATLNNLRKMLSDTERMIHKANLPGIPEEMDARLEEATERIFIVVNNLQEIPLNMETVYKNLEIAEKCIEEVRQTAVEMLENVQLIESIIQYGNRYRKTNPAMHQQLLEAEAAFRDMRYAKALETAATAVEAAEPGAMKKIQVLAKD
ncbi:septation ring formation regulator EzrA [Rummeliibacillus stabekisii]|uniref:septation ring formation regulator EzrA n=1 Tax=Rummeliibacillus stabekisii TaxID=241244 RepID=UPI001174EE55|nr:septation ring formation regulator EzrA [Rummeliibacillus stabekisii]MBB5168713.1 septation ring formation regulator [Rummeliibacillus stabekisii]GEL05148.1 septation ring formation regulator EzrA [Rummeliibacillus stabekisii]